MSRDIPIIFSTAMIKALLAGRKTMTRRLARTERKIPGPGSLGGESDRIERPSPWQNVKVGDRLWVREAAHYVIDQGTGKPAKVEGFFADNYTVPADDEWCVRSRPSIHMPRWASRITLPVTATKMEPLQDISEEDAIAEGIERNVDGSFGVRGPLGGWLGSTFATAREAFSYLWMSLHGADSWATNPLVVAPSFRLVTANIDAPEARAA